MECKRLAPWCVGKGKNLDQNLESFCFHFLVTSFRKKKKNDQNWKKLLSTQISLNRRDPSGCGGNKAPRGNHPPTPSQGVSRNPFNDAWNMNEGQTSVGNYSNFSSIGQVMQWREILTTKSLWQLKYPLVLGNATGYWIFAGHWEFF